MAADLAKEEAYNDLAAAKAQEATALKEKNAADQALTKAQSAKSAADAAVAAAQAEVDKAEADLQTASQSDAFADSDEKIALDAALAEQKAAQTALTKAQNNQKAAENALSTATANRKAAEQTLASVEADRAQKSEALASAAAAYDSAKAAADSDAASKESAQQDVNNCAQDLADKTAAAESAETARKAAEKEATSAASKAESSKAAAAGAQKAADDYAATIAGKLNSLGLFQWMADNTSLSTAVRKDAETAIQILTNTLSDGSMTVPIFQRLSRSLMISCTPSPISAKLMMRPISHRSAGQSSSQHLETSIVPKRICRHSIFRPCSWPLQSSMPTGSPTRSLIPEPSRAWKTLLLSTVTNSPKWMLSILTLAGIPKKKHFMTVETPTAPDTIRP